MRQQHFAQRNFAAIILQNFSILPQFSKDPILTINQYIGLQLINKKSKRGMQAQVGNFKNDVWANLENFFRKYRNKNEPEARFDMRRFEELISEIFKDQSLSQKDYLIKNHFRLDVDENGLVSFAQLGNYLFKRYCGELILQKKHKEGRIKNKEQRKVAFDEFLTLVNEAYAFLRVRISQQVADYIFNTVDKDRDRLITYGQYFEAIDTFVCNNQSEELRYYDYEKAIGKERKSRLRIHIWENFRYRYNAYLNGTYFKPNDYQCKSLFTSNIDGINENSLITISSINYYYDRSKEFQKIAPYLIYGTAVNELNNLANQRPFWKTRLEGYQFVKLLKNTFRFLSIGIIPDLIFYNFFEKIDKDGDGLISYRTYLDWVRRFLSVLVYRGDEFYVYEDDIDNNCNASYRYVKRYIFNDYSFSKFVRDNVANILRQFDEDCDGNFTEQQVKKALQSIMNEDQYELYYVVKNPIRFDKNKNNLVSLKELTDFCVGKHFGELIIQRLHKDNFYSQGSKRRMNKKEFQDTINSVLFRLRFQLAPEALVNYWFEVVDDNKNGWISYEQYFMFLFEFFGPGSTILDQKDKQLDDKIKNMKPLERFSFLFFYQLNITLVDYDFNKNRTFEIDQIRDILKKVFNFNSSQISYVVMKYFNYSVEVEESLSYDKFIAIVLIIYFNHFIINSNKNSNKFKSSNQGTWDMGVVSYKDFTQIFTNSSFFIKRKPSLEDLNEIFKSIDTDKNGGIKAIAFKDFVKKHLGKDIDLDYSSRQIDLQGVTAEEINFVDSIWQQLKAEFSRYDKGTKGSLQEAQLRAFVTGVLQEDLKYVPEHLMQYTKDADQNKNASVDFQEFATYFLNYTGMLALERFHTYQPKKKSSLTFEEFSYVFNNGYKYSNYANKGRLVQQIFGRIKSTANVAGYNTYKSWIKYVLVQKFNRS